MKAHVSQATVCRVLFLTFFLASQALLTQAQSTTAPAARNGFADINGGKLYYELAGQGHPLVLIHGGQMDSRIWDEQFALFAKSYRVIRYDFRGFGRSPASVNVFETIRGDAPTPVSPCRERRTTQKR
jgi:alpha-beta hydrolase superfamily lysophospholipase